MEKRRLRIGLLSLTPEWRSIMDHLGADYAQCDINSDNLFAEFSLIILNAKINKDEKSDLIGYLKQGGALLETKGFEVNYRDRISSKFKRVIYNQDLINFSQIPYLDLYTNVHLCDDAEFFSGLTHFRRKGNGCIGFLGVDLPEQIFDLNYKRKRFISHRLPFPDELVSKVSKGQLLSLLRSLLQKMHFQRDLPFIFKHTAPDNKPVFTFRIDSDFGDKNEVQKLLKLSENTQIPFTWFLHVKAHEDWLNEFKKYTSQELALHSYEHATSADSSRFKKDISRAADLLNSNGISFKGYAAPYGILNPANISATEILDLRYSSEFSFMYDSSPLFVPVLDRWQVPVHPICTGSMSRLRYSETDMRSYYTQKIEHHRSTHEPLMLYHHPMQKGFEMWRSILQDHIADHFNSFTFSGFINWQELRKKNSFKAILHKDQISITCESERKLCLNVSTGSNKFDLIKFKEQSLSTKVRSSFTYKKPYIPDNTDLNKNRKTDISLIKTGIIDSKNRKTL